MRSSQFALRLNDVLARALFPCDVTRRARRRRL